MANVCQFHFCCNRRNGFSSYFEGTTFLYTVIKLISSSSAAAFLTTYKSCKIFLSGFPLNCYNVIGFIYVHTLILFHSWLFMYFWTFLKIEKRWIPLSTIVLLSSYQSAVTWGMVFCFEDYSDLLWEKKFLVLQKNVW